MPRSHANASDCPVTADQVYLNIRLNHPPVHKFASGDIITGVVVLTNFKLIPKAAIGISFSGKIKSTTGIGDKLQKYEQDLFWLSKSLVAKDSRLAASTYSWQFNFEFPSHYSTKDNFKFIPSDLFLKDPPEEQGLPPTFNCRKPGGSGTGEIVYELKAIITGPYVVLGSTTTVDFEPTRSLLRSHIRQSSANLEKIYRIGIDGQPRIPSFWESKKKDSPENKTLAFQLRMDAPHSIILGSPYDITLWIKAEIEKEVVPVFTFKWLAAILTTTCRMRTPNALSEEVISETTKTYDDNARAGKVMPFNQPVIFTGFHFGKDFLLTPGFKSSALAISFSLKICIALTALGKEEVYCANPPGGFIEVLGSRFRAKESAPGQSSSGQVGDTPPSYDEIARGDFQLVLDDKGPPEYSKA